MRLDHTFTPVSTGASNPASAAENYPDYNRVASFSVFVVDDDKSVRQSLESLLKSVGYAVSSYATVQAFLKAYTSDQMGCLILDVRLPGVSGLDFHERLSSYGIRLPVILMTGHGDIPMTVRGMKAGAVDFLSKPFREQEILDAVAGALRLSHERQQIDLDRQHVQQRANTLTHREREVMLKVVSGKMNKQIAFELGLSEITVKIHRGNAMKKMGAKSLPDLVRFSEKLHP